MEIYSIFFGVFLGLFLPTAGKALQQTWSIWQRTRTLHHAYLWMIWTDTIVNFVFAIVTYLHLCGIVPPSYGFFFGTVLLWSFQTQLLPLIIANRVSLIMVDKKKARLLKWGLFIIIGLVNISVGCIWIPSQMKVSPTIIAINHVWEPVEKSFFLVVDLALNVYFLYLVRYRLIANGLTKYMRLFRFNTAIVGVSTSMDALLLGLLRLPDGYTYVQFAPVAYIVKLNIELSMAVMISKVVRSSSDRRDDRYAEGNHTLHGIHRTNSSTLGSRIPQQNSNHSVAKVDAHNETASSNWPVSYHKQDQHRGIVTMVTTSELPEDNCTDDNSEEGILRTVTMAVRSEYREEIHDKEDP
ncbi:hypothetical protein COCC4DRAFT_151123 [Bipolaris maydis ATCC 48331]|uniref:Uncharacterized protein n=2 Tax=Cochliobolus heterostrophus TaxID=5016 RepID=M2UZN2_COCH5|nr:uncharacterized protein COCC4DRAFT_151123 [Bipolaris maydis ATCC 48331]EMD93177.1 hypothetical protein COCHEDRAFT_1097534 [Bipolaris maydis C5]KAJ5025786.1 hypothetical protein J3E73DRAFT_190725 [Bipolaris maydis]ENI00230.1 hypothetical protein COCC4DRAFT_151123 [Bipolaris maydis ATCC 48331]KAJ6207999.1 hypothetical protein PSV09DRAFT_1097534 [Bipolaris maydis]KAJ6269997.1 hypothetical protein PSV08DRAFT_181056 [Bipolaris maydis]